MTYFIRNDIKESFKSELLGDHFSLFNNTLIRSKVFSPKEDSMAFLSTKFSMSLRDKKRSSSR